MSESPRPTEAAPGTGQRNWALTGLFMIALFAVLSYAEAFVVPVVLAFMFALTLSPVVRFLARRHVPQVVTALMLVVTVAVVLAAGAYYLSGPFGALLTDLPQMGSEIERKLRDLRAPVAQIQETTEQIEELTAAQEEQGPEEVVIKEPGLLSLAAANAPEVLARGFFTLVLMLFLLSSGDLFYTKMIRAMPTLSDKKTALRIAHDIEQELSRYLATVSLINGSLGICVGIGLWLIGMPNPALWGTLVAVLNFIPYVGSLISIVLVGAVALVTYPTLAQAALAPAVLLVLNGLEGQVVTPMVMGRRLAMNPVAVFLAIAFWGWLWGIVGVLMAVPLMVAVKIFCSHIDSLWTFNDFLSVETDAEPRPPKVPTATDP